MHGAIRIMHPVASSGAPGPISTVPNVRCDGEPHLGGQPCTVPNFCLRSYICCMAIEVEYKDDKCYGPYNACRPMLTTTR